MSANAREVPTHYSAAAKWLRWRVAVAVKLLLAGPAMKRIVPEGDLRDRLYNFREALGAPTLIFMMSASRGARCSGCTRPTSNCRNSKAAHLSTAITSFVDSGYQGDEAQRAPYGASQFSMFARIVAIGPRFPPYAQAREGKFRRHLNFESVS
jgi:hypothetical protein